MLNLDTEQKIFDLGYQTIAGVDEAGRGPLAGPVVAAAVVIDQNFKIDSEELKLVADSKKLTAKKREKIFAVIKKSVLDVQIGVINNQKIDQVNILQASFLAMKKALSSLKQPPDFVLVDGHLKIPKLNINQTAIVSGDASVFVVAAASIIAKVSRDWLMQEAEIKYPGYLFAKHKGYGTKIHLSKIKEFGPCPLHRLSFAPFKVKVLSKKLK